MPLKTHKDDIPQLNLTSMIDVVFLLIIFFMVGTKFTELERNIGLQVPEVSAAAALSAAPEKKVVHIYRDGQIVYNRRAVSLDQLSAELAAAQREYHELGVLVRGDAAASFQHVADVLAACRHAGVAELNIAVKPASTTTAAR